MAHYCYCGEAAESECLYKAELARLREELSDAAGDAARAWHENDRLRAQRPTTVRHTLDMPAVRRYVTEILEGGV